jgi:hypothetical protein
MSYDEDETETDEDPVSARMVPRRFNRWIFATIASELATNVMRAASDALADVTTVFSQQWNYTDDRQKFEAEVGREIETLVGGFEVTYLEDEDAGTE